MTEASPKKSLRGFASMSPERRREIARKGGASVPNDKRSFAQNRDLAVAAGRKGGESVPDTERSFSKNRDLAARAGKKGGERPRTVRRIEEEVMA